MKKNIIKLISMISVFSVMVFGFTGCPNKGEDKKQSEQQSQSK